MVNTLQDFLEIHKDGFDSIAVDITGFCNAKCKYCPAGNDLTNAGKYISLDKYEMIIKKLKEYKLLSRSTKFHVYSLGEPCLHPYLDDILKITKNNGIKTSISTNGSKVPILSSEGLEGVSRFLISMPGFSQDSYDRIHGFDFEKIKSNIIKLKHIVDNYSNFTIPFDMTFHIYQFNGNEIEAARQFCEMYGIRFSPNYAVLMNKNKCLDYVTNQMSYAELKDISTELFLGVLDHQIKVSPRNYCDFQNSFLSLTVEGDVRICSSFTHDYESKILCGNILRDDINQIISKKFSHPRCDICIKAGLTLGKGYDCKVFPDYYFALYRENEYLKDQLKTYGKWGRENEKILKLIHQIRYWEEVHYDKEEERNLIYMLKSDCIDIEDVKYICEKYSRFGKNTYFKIEELVCKNTVESHNISLTV